MGLDVVLIGADEVQRGYEDDPESIAWYRNLWDHSCEAVPQLRTLPLGECDSDAFSARVGSYGTLHLLRELAVHLEFTGKPPVTYEGTDSALLSSVYRRERQTRRFPHLVDFSDCEGWYLPLELAEPVWIQYGESERQVWSVGSSIALLRELKLVNEHLQVPFDYGQLEDRGGDPYEAFRAMKGPVWPWAVLHWMARVSVEQKLVMSFC